MPGNKAGGQTLRNTMIAKHGSEEAWLQWMRENGSKGGRKTADSGKLALVGFASNRELAREAGAKGGRISRRGKKD